MDSNGSPTLLECPSEWKRQTESPCTWVGPGPEYGSGSKGEVVVGGDEEVAVWPVGYGEKRRAVLNCSECDISTLTCGALLSDPRYAVMGGGGAPPALVVVDLAAPSPESGEQFQMSGHERAITSLTMWSAEREGGRLPACVVATACEDGMLGLWWLEPGADVGGRSLGLFKSEMKDKDTIAGIVALFTPEIGPEARMACVSGDSLSLWTGDFSPSGPSSPVASGPTSVTGRKAQRLQRTATFEGPHEGGMCVAALPCGGFVVGGFGPKITIRDALGQALVRRFPDPSKPMDASEVYCSLATVALGPSTEEGTPNGIVTGSTEGNLLFWKTTGSSAEMDVVPVAKLAGVGASIVNHVAVVPDGKGRLQVVASEVGEEGDFLVKGWEMGDFAGRARLVGAPTFKHAEEPTSPARKPLSTLGSLPPL